MYRRMEVFPRTRSKARRTRPTELLLYVLCLPGIAQLNPMLTTRSLPYDAYRHDIGIRKSGTIVGLAVVVAPHMGQS